LKTYKGLKRAKIVVENESESFLVGICSLDKGVYFGNSFEVKRMVKRESWEK
jgi:hypothetical protein